MDRPFGPDPLSTYLVERYWPGIDLSTLHVVLGRLDAAARAMTFEGRRVEHLGSITLIAAPDESDVREVNARAGLPVDRISAAVTLPSAALPNPQGGLSS
jgi:hypothetical protein